MRLPTLVFILALAVSACATTTPDKAKRCASLAKLSLEVAEAISEAIEGEEAEKAHQLLTEYKAILGLAADTICPEVFPVIPLLPPSDTPIAVCSDETECGAT